MKKNHLILVIALVVVLIIGGVGLLSRNKKDETSGEKVPTVAPEVQLPLEERPFFSLVPTSDGHWVEFKLSGINQAKTVEYELGYLAGGGNIPRGTKTDEAIDLNNSSFFSRKFLFGSESCSGTGESRVCRYRYDEDIVGGDINISLQGTILQKYALSYRLFKGSEAANGIELSDGNFIFEGNLPTKNYFTMLPAIGLPNKIEGKVLAGPYGIFTAGSNQAKGKITIKLEEPASEVKIFGWDQTSKSWKEYTKGFETDGEVVSVEVDFLTTFVAVSQ
jgi:hypothetical protein